MRGELIDPNLPLEEVGRIMRGRYEAGESIMDLMQPHIPGAKSDGAVRRLIVEAGGAIRPKGTRLSKPSPATVVRGDRPTGVHFCPSKTQRTGHRRRSAY